MWPCEAAASVSGAKSWVLGERTYGSGAEDGIPACVALVPVVTEDWGSGVSGAEGCGEGGTHDRLRARRRQLRGEWSLRGCCGALCELVQKSSVLKKRMKKRNEAAAPPAFIPHRGTHLTSLSTSSS